MSEFSTIAYHGTLEIRVASIRRNGFKLSSKPKEWLGEGIYFFDKLLDAKEWAINEVRRSHNCQNRAAILTYSLECAEEEFFNFDDASRMSELELFIDDFVAEEGYYPDFSDVSQSYNDNRNRIRCFFCKFFQRANPQYKIYAFTFPRIYHNKAQFQIVKNELQYCVTDNNFITYRGSEVLTNVS